MGSLNPNNPVCFRDPLDEGTSLRDVFHRFKINSEGFWTTYRLLIYLFIIALFCDTLSTVHFMSFLGPDGELHPAVRIASQICGPVAGPFLGASAKLAACIVVSIYCRKFAPVLLTVASGIYFFAAWYNIWGIHP